jgi:hypothetical protein
MEVDYIGIQYMVVQREDTTEMGTIYILLEEVYQGQYVMLESSKTVVG